MDKIRIPMRFMKQIVDDLAQEPNKEEWNFSFKSGHELVVKRVQGEARYGAMTKGESFDSLDFAYNPNDD